MHGTAVLQHKCLVNPQVSSEGAKHLYHAKDKQTVKVCLIVFLLLFVVCKEKGKVLNREDTIHKHF